MRRLASLTLLSFVVTALACNDGGGPPPANPTTVATTAPPPVTTVVVDAGAVTAPAPAPLPVVAAPTPPTTPTPVATVDAGADFFACGGDADCVAVPKAACCPTGHKEAVNKQSVDAYKASVPCEANKRRMCPMYRILDKRVPICANGTHKCEMVAADKVACAGSGPDVHACPGGAPCDSSGHCTAAAASATP